MAKKFNNKGYNKNYNQGGKNYSKSYSANNYNSNVDRMTPFWKKVNWTPLIAVVLALLCFGGLFFFTNGFYADHLMFWDTKEAWFCPLDNNVYVNNENALVTADSYTLMKSGKKLKIDINAEKIPVEDRNYVRYSVLYYSAGDCVYQSAVLKPDYDTLTGESAVLNLFEYNDVLVNGPYYAKEQNSTGEWIENTSIEKTVESVRVSVLYLKVGENISFKQKVLFTEAIMVDYVEV